MKIWVLKNPNATTRAITSATPREGWDEMEDSDFIAWRDAQPELITEPPQRWEVLRDTLVSRVMAHIGRETTLAILAQMSDAQRLEFLAFDRFWSDNSELRAFVAAIPYTYEQDDGEGNITQVQGHLDPDVILARDPRI